MLPRAQQKFGPMSVVFHYMVSHRAPWFLNNNRAMAIPWVTQATRSECGPAIYIDEYRSGVKIYFKFRLTCRPLLASTPASGPLMVSNKHKTSGTDTKEYMMVRLQPVLSLLMVLALVGATSCATWFGRAAADALIPVEEERKLGEEMQQELHDELTFSDDEVLTNYVEQLGFDLARQAENRPRGIDIQFYLVDDDEMMNAFAIPGGGIYVFTGLLQEMESEAELTAVLAHELAHVTRRHVAERLVAIYGTEVVAGMALGEEPGLVAQLATAIAQQGFLLSYSRSHERDADRWGVTYQVATGYDPQGFIAFFQRLEDQPSPPTFLSTHPPPAERIENIQQQIDELDNVPTRTERERFEQMRDRI